MKSKGLIVAVAVMVGLLGITAALVLLGRRESVAEPSATSFAPSGSAAFRELLQRSGYKTDVTVSVLPRLAKSDVLVVFDYVVHPEDVLEQALLQQQSKAKQAIEAHLKEGGRVLILPVDKDFRAASILAEKSVGGIHVAGADPRSDAAPDQLRTSQPAPEMIKANYGSGSPPETVLGQYAADPDRHLDILKTNTEETFAAVFQVGKGRALVARDGLFATNRFLDRQQNAELGLRLVRTIAPKGATLIFDEIGFGDAIEPGVLETIGPWAEAMWFQFLFLLAVLIYGFSKPFGLPIPDRVRQQGGRQLLDAVADTFRRGRMTQIALDSAHRTASATLRNALHLPANSSPRDLHVHLPASVQSALNAVLAASTAKTKAEPARNLVVALEREVDAFVGAHQRSALGIS